MGRARKPTHLRLVSGTRDKRPSKLREAEPKPRGDLAEAPGWLEPRHREVWADVVEAAPSGLLKRIDGAMLEGWVIAYCIREAATKKLKDTPMVLKTPNGAAVQSPYIGIVNRQTVIMKSLAAEMGFSPAARTRIALDEGGEEGDATDRFFG